VQWSIGGHVGVEKEQVVIVIACLAVMDDGDMSELRVIE
jgi:hypothetical protein